MRTFMLVTLGLVFSSPLITQPHARQPSKTILVKKMS
jgi:hypothetical protein